VKPVDKWYRSHCKNFYLHHCGILDKYLDIYTELNPTCLDIGGGSDYKLMRRYFSDNLVSLIVNAEFVEQAKPKEIDTLISNMVHDAEKDKVTGMYCADVSTNMADDAIKALRTANERIDTQD
jgi:hypothetical protein